MSLAPGRSHDLKMLEERLKTAKSGHERDLIKSKIDYLYRESKDKEIAELRRQLVGAARNGDNQAGEAISEQIYQIQHRLKR